MRKKENGFFTAFAFILFFVFLAANVKAQVSKLEMDSLVRALGNAKEDTGKVRLLLKLANEAGYSDLKKALAYAQDGYALSNKLNYEWGRGTTTYSIAITYLDMGEYTLADSFLVIAEKKFEQLHDKKNLTKIANARGGMNYMTGKYLLAADFYSKSAAGFDEIGDTVNALIAYQNLIAVLGQIKNHEQAVALGRKVLKIVDKGNDTLQMGYTLQGLVTELIYAEKMDEAAGYIDRLSGIGSSIGDQNLSAEIYATLGTYHYKKNEFDRAAGYFSISLQKAEALNNNYQLANHYNSLGQANYRLGNFVLAREQLSKGLLLARQYKNRRAESNLSRSLSTLYDSSGDYQNAYRHLLTHSMLNDSLLNSETRNYTSQLEVQYETNKKENEILRLQQVQQEKDFAIKRRNFYMAIGVGLIATLVGLLYLLRRNYRNRQKLSEQQAALLEAKIKAIENEQQIVSLQSMINGQETERTRIAKDLHDGIGGIFSTVKMHYSMLQRDTPEIKNNSLYKKTLDLINTAADELRTVAHSMMPEVLLKVGLIEALRDFCDNISSGKLLKITLQDFGLERRLNASTEIMLYRIIQELVNNIIKHAHATEAIIQVNRQGNRLGIIIEDNGRGFDTLEAAEKRGMGMATVKSRVDYLNGKLTIDSRKDIGTTVMIDLLINDN